MMVGCVVKKAHAHVREICNNSKEPATKLALAARALRLCKKLSGEHLWTVWNLSKVAYVAHERFQKLCVVDEFVHCCPCGKSKDPISAIRVDAAQFFKNASVGRGVKKSATFLARLQFRTKFNGILVRRSKKAFGYLGKPSQAKGKAYDFVYFDDIIKGLRYAASDTFFCIW